MSAPETSSGGLPTYAGLEVLDGRLRCHNPPEILVALRRDDLDPGDEDDRER